MDTMAIELVGGIYDGQEAQVPVLRGFLPEYIDMAWMNNGTMAIVRYIPATREPLKSADGNRRLYMLKGGA